jgi:hypothetical protein
VESTSLESLASLESPASSVGPPSAAVPEPREKSPSSDVQPIDEATTASAKAAHAWTLTKSL